MVNLCRQGAEDCFNQGWFLRRAAALKENLALNNVQSCDKEEEEEEDDDVYESLSDVGEIRVYFASKILTPCRMH